VKRIGGLLVVALCAAAPARAQIVGEAPTVAFPDPHKFARGFFAEADVGAQIYLAKAGQFAAPGPVFRWLAVQALVTGSISSATTPPPTSGQDFELFVYGAEARLQLQIRRFGLFAAGGAGVAQITTNILDAPGVTNGRSLSFTVIAGGGLDFHTLNRHFSIGVAGDYLFFTQFTGGHAIDASLYLKYTR
jgi:hypothetical protein